MRLFTDCPCSISARCSLLLIMLAILLACAPAEQPRTDVSMPVDRIFVNARIWTGSADITDATAIAITGEHILAVGSDADIRALADENTRIEDLGGRRMLPGFHDAHWHLPTRPAADLVDARDSAEINQRLLAFGQDLPDEAWITGRGWTPDMFSDNTAHRRHLDEAFPQRPVLITDRDGHQALANSQALALAGVTGDTPAPHAGEIVHDTDGSPTGLLKETAMNLVREMLPPLDAQDIELALHRHMHDAAALGLTALQLANAPGEFLAAAFERALDEDTFRVRFRAAVPFSADTTEEDIAGYADLRDRHTGMLLRYGIAKGMLDGTVDVGTAAMLEPFAQHDHAGMAMWQPAELNDMVTRYDAAGLQVQLHAIGDGAIRMALDAFEHAAAVNGPRDRRHRVEHLEVPHPDDLPRFAELGVVASSQAIFAIPDTTTLNVYAPMLGPERAARANNFRAIDEAGAIQAFGSDFPVFPMDPLLGIYTAVTRQTPEGTPEGGWFPENRISIEAALRHYTWGSAYAAFREHELGVLAPGMLADLVVLSEDILDAPPEALLRARSILTVMGGRDTYREVTR
jgi:predicted amidohydrolase YtcJ